MRGEEKAGRVTQRATSSQPSASFFFRNGIKTGPQEFLCVSNFSPTWTIARHHRPMSSLRQIIEDGTGNRVWKIIHSLRPLLFRYLEAPGKILLPPTVKRRPVSIWSSSPFLPPLSSAAVLLPVRRRRPHVQIVTQTRRGTGGTTGPVEEMEDGDESRKKLLL